MALSTKILGRAMLWVFSVSSLLNLVPLLNGGITRVAPTSDSIWSMTKPLSAMHASPGSSRRRIPDCRVIYLSDIELVNSFEIKVITPHGAMPIRPFGGVGVLVGGECFRLEGE